MNTKLFIAITLVLSLAGPPALAADDRQIVAVFDIQTKFFKLSRAKKSALTAVLSSELALGGVYQVMPPGDVKRLLLDQSRNSYKNCYDEKCQIQLGRQLPANKLLTCTIVRLGGQCRVTGSLYDLKRQTTDTSAREAGPCTEKALVSSIEKVAGKLRSWSKKSAQSTPRAQPARDEAIGEKPVAWTPQVNQALLDVSSSPSGLDVWLDGKQLGKTPIQGQIISTGPHEVLVRSPCHYDSGKRFFANQNDRKIIDLKLPQKLGAVYVDARTKDGRSISGKIFIDGKAIGQTPGPHQVSVCARKVEVKHSQHGRWASRLNVQERQVQRFQSVVSSRPQFPKVSAESSYKPSQTPLIESAITHLAKRYYPQASLQASQLLQGALETLHNHNPDLKFKKLGNGRFQATNTKADKSENSLSAHNMTGLANSLTRLVQLALPGMAAADQAALEFVVLNGALEKLDTHTRILKPDQMRQLEIQSGGSFGGLGVSIRVQDNWIQVMAPVEGTPAWRAGIQPLDQIVNISGRSTQGMQLNQAVQIMRGEPGTKITIETMRQGWSRPKKLVLTRELIKIKSVESKLLADGIAHVRVKSFGKDSAQHVSQQLTELEKRVPLKGLILDLRSNPGGLLNQAAAMTDLFISTGKIYSVVSTDKRQDENAKAQSSDRLKLPIIVLCDRGTASGSEIVLGSLKSHDRAVVMGERTFGKGSVQVLYRLKHKFAMRMSIGEYLAAGVSSFEKDGFEPDILMLPSQEGKSQSDDRLGIRYTRQKSSKADYTLELAQKILSQHGKASRLGTLDAAAGMLQTLYNKSR